MSESESMSLQEESQENQSMAPDQDVSDQESQHVDQESQESEEIETSDQVSSDQSIDDLSSVRKKKEYKEEHSAQFEAFKKDFDKQPDFEAKLQLAVDFMEASLAQGGTPHFRSFWEARRLCLC